MSVRLILAMCELNWCHYNIHKYNTKVTDQSSTPPSQWYLIP